MEIDCCFSQLYYSALKILVDNNEDRLMLIYNQGLQMLTEAFHTLHVMYHEATACHVTADIVDLLSILVSVLKVGRNYIDQKKGKGNTDKVLTKPTVKNCNSLFGETLFIKRCALRLQVRKNPKFLGLTRHTVQFP